MTADQDGTGLLAQIRRISPEKFADLYSRTVQYSSTGPYSTAVLYGRTVLYSLYGSRAVGAESALAGALGYGTAVLVQYGCTVRASTAVLYGTAV